MNNASISSSSSSYDYSCSGKLALVTGATGRVGSLVTKMLLEKGFCVRIFSRSNEKVEVKFGHVLQNQDNNEQVIEVAIGNLGDGTTVSKAFLPRDTSNGVSVSHVVYAAGGEEADFDAVNNRGVAECAFEAAKAGSKKMIVISAAWVSKPYSLASLLFNALYPNYPMARHFQGEQAVREAVAHSDSNLSYVILRAGRLVPDSEYPATGPKGLLYEQGDAFSFFGPAGQPGMCNTQLADAVVTALDATSGKYTLEVTSGPVDTHDTSVYDNFSQDVLVAVSSDDVEKCHAEGIRDLKIGLLFLVTSLLVTSSLCSRVFQRVFVVLVGLAVFVISWSLFLSDISVVGCSRHSLVSLKEL